MKTAIIYARVATADEPIQSQLSALRKFALQHGFEVVAEYKDIGISGTKARRHGLDALLRDAQNRKFHVVLVTSIDRVVRSGKHLLQIMEELDGLNIRFVSLREGIDTADVTGRQFLGALRTIAALEKSLCGERIKVAMRRARSEGQRMGRAPLNVNRNAIACDRIAGSSLTNVAKKYGISRASVVRFVREAQRRNIAVLGGIPVGQQQKATAVEFVA